MCSTVLPCPLCCQPNFHSVDSLRISLVSVTNRPLECPICCDVLFGLDKLTIHLFSHTMNKDSLMETKYDRNIPNVDLPKQSHIMREAKIESLCNDNQIIESSKENLLKYQNHWHESSVSAKREQSPLDAPVDRITEPQCDICGSSFRTVELQQMHLKLVHEVSDEVIQLTDTVHNDKDSTNCFQCHLCSKVFKMKGSLRVHLRVVHSFGKSGSSGLSLLNEFQSNTISNNSATDGIGGLHNSENKLNNVEVTSWECYTCAKSIKLEKQQRKTSTAPVATTIIEPQCDICGKLFTTKYFLKKHKRLHSGEQPYSCGICGKSFTFQQSYHKHLLYHSDDKPHICPTCGRAFKELSTLHNHERIHSGEKPFRCETCDKCFRQRVSYLVHRRIHTGSMPYKCTACCKSFRYKVSQRTHKCLAQPPGTVVRQTGDLLQRLIQSVSLSSNIEDNNDSGDKDFLNLSLDEFVKESCDKIGLGDNGTVHFEEDTATIPIEVQIPSPSEKFQNMCLYSPDAFGNSLETINEASFKQLLYGNEDSAL